MFFQSREDTRAVIGKLQVMACAYSIIVPPGLKQARTCDCKYGGTNLMKGTEAGNGCPELRSVDEILAVMTDREWNMLTKRVNKQRDKSLRAQLKKSTKKASRKKR